MAWVGVDLDGTLAVADENYDPEHVGELIPEMVERVQTLLDIGYEVRIFTARVYAPPNDAEQQARAALAVLAIQKVCKKAFGRALPITCTKDYAMAFFFDDRAVPIETNTGKTRGKSPWEN